MAERRAPNGGPNKYILPAVTLLVAAFFFATSFRAGWNRAETDFPNYYTAAVLVRKGAPLHNYYDWTWFQRQMNYAGTEHQLGGYIPQTPLTMLPIVPLAGFAPQAAKRIWLLLNVIFLVATLQMLARVTRFGVAAVALLAFAGWGSLSTNFLLGQYYVFLLFLLTLAFYCAHRGKPRSGRRGHGSCLRLEVIWRPVSNSISA